MRIKNLPSIESMNGSQDALVIEQTDGSEDKSRKVSPAQIKQYVQTGDFEATGEVKDGHGNKLADMAKADEVKGLAEAGDFEATGEVIDGHGNVLGDKVECGLYASPVQTIQSKQHIAITIQATFPSTVFAAAVMNTPNAAYVFANVVEITPTKVQVGAYNDYTNSLAGDFKIIYFYKKS